VDQTRLEVAPVVAVLAAAVLAVKHVGLLLRLRAIRRDAVTRSRDGVTGKVVGHLAPYFGAFPYNPKDVRFLGSPVDLVVFDGLDEGALREVVFVEVKTGGSTLTPRERQVRDAIQAGRVSWEEFRRA